MAENPFSKSLAAGKSRRRTAGESAGGPGRDIDSAPAAAQHTGEKRIAVDLPSQLYTDAKILAAQQGTTVKEIITSALAKEIAARRGQR